MIELLEEIYKCKFLLLGLHEVFLDMTCKVQEMKEEFQILNCKNLKVCSSQGTIKKVKRPFT